jgi:hypothetical protein
MQYEKSFGIITKQVLNNNTGELENVDFKEVKERKRLKGGFKMVYSTYDEALLKIVKSGKDLEIIVKIRDMFTYNQVEVSLQSDHISKLCNVAKSKSTLIISRMENAGIIMRVRRGVYRLNPFMYLPFRAESELLQQEWNDLCSVKKSNKLSDTY